MESVLNPRQIQTRIRGGASLADVAAAAGVPTEQLAAFVAPIIAERKHIATQARALQLRTRHDSATSRSLGAVVTEALTKAGVAEEDIAWDAWRDEDRNWTVTVSWFTGEDVQCAEFAFNNRSRFSTARNETARELIGDLPERLIPTGSNDPDSEPTLDLHDELAIVRAVQNEDESPAVLPDVPANRIVSLPDQELLGEPDDYVEPELAEVDGVYDIVPNLQSDMDVLYEMLSGFNEDSVRIYTDLTQPVNPEADIKPNLATLASTSIKAEQPITEAMTEANSAVSQIEQAVEQIEQAVEQVEQVIEQVEQVVEQTPAKPVEPAKPAVKRTRKSAKAAVKPAQDALPNVDETLEPTEPIAAPKPAKKTTRRKRASVPSWDEIVFGGPKPGAK